MTATRLPALFVSHGGGPWPFIDGVKQQYALTERELRQLSQRLPDTPKAILIISAHWEADQFTVSTAERPSMEYDYYGFPEHTYRIQYPAPGSPALAARVRELLKHAGIECREDSKRGFDHGTFIPLGLVYPDAEIPVVALSMKSGYDAAQHIRLGKALSALRDEGVLIIGSGLTYHNMRGFRRSESTAVAEDFEHYLNDAIAAPQAATRNQMLVDWEQAPSARLAHPQEDHLIPLMVVAGAAGDDTGKRVFVDHVMNVAMATYVFGEFK